MKETAEFLIPSCLKWCLCFEDVCRGVFDFIADLVVVDVVCHAPFLQ
jgi:hypothetical protein